MGTKPIPVLRAQEAQMYVGRPEGTDQTTTKVLPPTVAKPLARPYKGKAMENLKSICNPRGSYKDRYP